VRELPIPADFCQGDYTSDGDFRARFQRWLDELWREKDRQLAQLLT
jgi:hypothetical protein